MKRAAAPGTGNLSDRVVRHLINHIRRNRLPWGAAIPSEVRLAAQLGVSRGIVREAYRSMAAAGILEIANGRSPRVARLSNRTLTQFLQHAMATEQASRAHVFDVRTSIEVRAAELAAGHRTEHDADTLYRETTRMRASRRRREDFVRADLRFHEAVGRATGNPLFALLTGSFRESLDQMIRAGFVNRRSAGEVDRIVEIHQAIAQAIIDGDAARAREMMAIHFDESREFVLGLGSRAAEPVRSTGA